MVDLRSILRANRQGPAAHQGQDAAGPVDLWKTLQVSHKVE